MTKTIPFHVALLAAFLLLFFAPGQSAALDVYMSARQFTKTMPDGAGVVMWGFATDADSDLTTDGGEAASSPGPMITVPPGDDVLNIHLRNDLGVPVSLVIPALPSRLDPVRFIDPAGRQRARSLDAETAPGQVRTYSWSVRPGSFIYHSATHMPVQVPMGLYGGVKKDAAPGQAYPGAEGAYSREVTLFYAEVDPALNAAVAAGTYGTAAYPSTVNFSPRYFLVNGEPYSGATPAIAAGSPGERTLLRFFNAGIETHAPVTQGLYMRLLAEDGYPYPSTREQYSVALPAGKTADALITPSGAGDFPVYDRRLFLVNGGSSPGGLFSVLRVSAGLFAADDAYGVGQGSVLSVAAPGVCSNDGMAPGALASMVAGPANGLLTLGADGAFTYTPDAPFSGQDSFTYRLSANGTESNVATVSITVTPVVPAPVAADDAYTVDEDATLAVVAPGVLANDTVTGTNPRAILVSGAARGTVSLGTDGAFSYRGSPNLNGADSFTYRIVTDSSASNEATVAVTVRPVNDPPTARNDSATTQTSTPVVIAVLANDTDVEGGPLTVAELSPPANGTAAVNADNTVTYTPNAGFSGTDSFTYRASDGELISGPATVTIRVISTPAAVDDAYSVNEDATLVVASPGVLANDAALGYAPSAQVVSWPSHGTLVLAADGAVEYRPDLNFYGADSFAYRFSTGGVLSTTATVTITVNPVNDAPTAAYDSVSTAFNTAVVIGALSNDADPDGDALSIAAVTGAPTGGTVVVNPDNTFTYTPNAGYSGTDRFYYTATDGTVASNVARVVVKVRANQPPVAVIDYADTLVDTPVLIDLAANDYDPDGTIDRGSVTVLTSPGRGGTVVNNLDGTVTFTPRAGFKGSDYFYYNIRDSYGAVSRSAKVTVHVRR